MNSTFSLLSYLLIQSAITFRNSSLDHITSLKDHRSLQLPLGKDRCAEGKMEKRRVSVMHPKDFGQHRSPSSARIRE